MTFMNLFKTLTRVDNYWSRREESNVIDRKKLQVQPEEAWRLFVIVFEMLSQLRQNNANVVAKGQNYYLIVVDENINTLTSHFNVIVFEMFKL